MLKRSSDIALQITETADLKLTLKIKKYPVIFLLILKTRDLPEVLPVGQKALSWLRL